MPPQEQVRIRISYAKYGNLRFIGHLDMQRLWERVLRRSRLPIEFSKGFSPRARINLASALPLGITSLCEIMDFWMSEPVGLKQITELIDPWLPGGISINKVETVSLSLPSLQSSIDSSEYQAVVNPNVDIDELNARIQDYLASPSLMRIRRNKSYDLRPLTFSLVLNQKENPPTLVMCLSARESATGRPDEVLSQLGYDPVDFEIIRTKITFAPQ